MKELERRHERQNAEATRFAEIKDEQRRTALITTRAQATLDIQRSVAGEEERALERRETIATQGIQKRAAIETKQLKKKQKLLTNFQSTAAEAPIGGYSNRKIVGEVFDRQRLLKSG